MVKEFLFSIHKQDMAGLIKSLQQKCQTFGLTANVFIRSEFENLKLLLLIFIMYFEKYITRTNFN